MINKEYIFAQGSENIDAPNTSAFRQGMVPQTVARAEEVNMSGFMSDRDLYVVCQELKNLMALYGVVPNNSYSSGQQGQIAAMFDSVISNGLFITGLYTSDPASAPTQNGTAITFPETKVQFNTDVLYGQTKASQVVATIEAQTLSATNSWVDGVHFIYANLPTPSSTTATIEHQTDPISAADGASKCMLGSVFVINGDFQSGTWKFQPWLNVTSIDTRQSPTAYTKGGFVSAASSTTLQMGALEIKDEGINYDSNRLLPGIMTVAAKNPFTYKYLYPDYNPAASDVSTLDTTHLYNMTDGTWDDISSLVDPDAPKYMIIVPCITPAGQTLMIPAMSYKTGLNYDQLFDTQEAAVNAVYSLPYTLGNVAKRAIYLGQSLIVRVGATDLTDPLQMISIGMLPQALAGFSSASGQAGGGITSYRPMPAITWQGYTNITCQNNTKNIIVDPGQQVTVSMPNASNGIVNQLEVEYTMDTGSIVFSGVNWWFGVTPTFVSGKTYLIIFEYVNGNWVGGIMVK